MTNPCDEGLLIKPNLSIRELGIGLRHDYHFSHVNIQPSPATPQFITLQRQYHRLLKNTMITESYLRGI